MVNSIKEELRVVVFGGRDYTNRDAVYILLSTLFSPIYPSDSTGSAGTWLPRPDLFLILGGAKGVDSFAEDWAIVHWVNFKVYPAKWDEFGKAAGAIRNQQMIDEGRPKLGIAFPGGRGTNDMKYRIRKAKIPLLEVPV